MWGTSSRPLRRFFFLASGVACLFFASAFSAEAKVFYAQDEAIELAFPGADRVEETNYILKPADVESIEKRSRAQLEGELFTVFTGWKEGRVMGYAYIEVHQVRTLPEALMIVLSPTGEVTSVRVLAFYEPLEYLPRERWFRQFLGVSRKNDLRLGWDIHGVSGATLSARAATASVRRFLAAYAVLIVPSEIRAAEISNRPDGASPVE